MYLLETILFCSSLVAAAPRALSGVSAIGQISPRGALLDPKLARISDAQAVALVTNPTCWGGSGIKWPQNDCPPPTQDKPIPQLDIFKRPASTPNTITFNNYCDYDIHYEHLGASFSDVGVLKAGGSKSAPLTGTVFKASKTPDRAKVVLVEYSVAGDGKLWYNLSLVKCLGNKNGLYTSDMSGCAGHEAGLQFGNSQVRSYQCAPGLWCDDQAYLYDENLCKKQNPVTQCSPSDGVTMEFCASKKK